MSAPSLPETFGNYALGDFTEVTSPDSINWLPQTLGWQILGILLLLLLLRAGWRKLVMWHDNRYRREANRQLRQIETGQANENLIATVNSLLKRVAIVAYQRDNVARLSGLNWTDFLNAQCDTAPFDDKQLAVLASGGYQSTPLESEEAEKLLHAAGHWINNHRVSRDA